MAFLDNIKQRAVRSALWVAATFSTGTAVAQNYTQLPVNQGLETTDNHNHHGHDHHNETHDAHTVSLTTQSPPPPAGVKYYGNHNESFESTGLYQHYGSNLNSSTIARIDPDKATEYTIDALFAAGKQGTEWVHSVFGDDYEATFIHGPTLQKIMDKRDNYPDISTYPNIVIHQPTIQQWKPINPDPQYISTTPQEQTTSRRGGIHMEFSCDNPEQATIYIPVTELQRLNQEQLLDIIDHEMSHYRSAALNTPEWQKLTAALKDDASPEQKATFLTASRAEESRADSMSLNRTHAFDARLSWITQDIDKLQGQDIPSGGSHPTYQERAELTVRAMVYDSQQTDEMNREIIQKYDAQLPFELEQYYDQFSQEYQQEHAFLNFHDTSVVPRDTYIPTTVPMTVEHIAQRTNDLAIQHGAHTPSDEQQAQPTPITPSQTPATVKTVVTGPSLH